MDYKGYVSIGPVTDATVPKYGELVPLPLEEAWIEGGTWATEDGYMRIVDPVAFEDILPEVLPSMPGAYALMATAFGDLFVVHEDIEYVVYFRFGFFMTFGHKFAIFTPDDVADRGYQDRLLFRTTYDDAVRRLGTPDIDECFGYTLPLSMGGPQTAENLSRRKLREHLAFLVAAGGEPRHYDVVHPPSTPEPGR